MASILSHKEPIKALRYEKEQAVKPGRPPARQIKARSVSPGNRSLNAKRLDTKVHRKALQNNRSESAQLAQKKLNQAK